MGHFFSLVQPGLATRDWYTYNNHIRRLKRKLVKLRTDPERRARVCRYGLYHELFFGQTRSCAYTMSTGRMLFEPDCGKKCCCCIPLVARRYCLCPITCTVSYGCYSVCLAAGCCGCLVRDHPCYSREGN